MPAHPTLKGEPLRASPADPDTLRSAWLTLGIPSGSEPTEQVRVASPGLRRRPWLF